MRKLFLALAILAAPILFAQPSDGEIWKYIHTAPTANIQQVTSDSVGNLYICAEFNGDSYDFNGTVVPGTLGGDSQSLFLLKLDATGKLVWMHSVHGEEGTSAQAHIKKIKVNQNGETAVLFTIQNTDIAYIGETEVSSNATRIIPILATISKQGRIQWAYPLVCESDSITPQVEASDIVLDEEGSCYATGYFMGSEIRLGTAPRALSTFKEYRSFITRINPDGNIDWFEVLRPENMAQTTHLEATLIDASQDQICIAGRYNGNRRYRFGSDTLGNSLGTDVFVANFSTQGAAISCNQVFGDASDYPEQVALAPNGDIVLLGFTDAYTLTFQDQSFDLQGTTYNLFLARYTNSNLVNATALNTQIINYDFYGRNAYFAIDKSSDITLCCEYNTATLFSGANTLTNAQTGTTDIAIAKLSGTTFNTIWSGSGSAAGNNTIEAAFLDSYGNIFLGGTPNNALNINGEPIAGALIEGTMYCAKITPNGDFGYAYWHENFDNAFLYAKGIAGDGYGNCYLAGSFTGSEASLDGTIVTNTDNQGIVIAKYARSRNISGTVRNNANEAVNDGVVKLYGYTYYQNSPLNDSIPIQPDGSFEFVDVPNGNYLVMVVPKGEAANTYLPTYYPSAEYWEFGNRLRIFPGINVTPIEIVLNEASELLGGTELNGNFSEKDLTKDLFNKLFEKGKPQTEAQVVIAGNRRYEEKSSYQIVATTTTDDNGDFAFFNIENGTYNLWIDYPGLPCEPIYLITVDNNQLISNINYLSTEEIIEPEGLVDYNNLLNNTPNSGIRIFPNPATEFLTLEIDDFTRGIADIYSASGKHIKHLLLERAQQEIPVKDFKCGQYFIRIRTKDKLVFEKFMIID